MLSHSAARPVASVRRASARGRLASLGTCGAVVLALALAVSTTSCGGGGDFKAQDMVLVEFLFVDRALNPTQPTGTQNLPRNAQILMVFSEQVNPQTVDTQTIQIRYGPQFQSIPIGSFSVDGNTVRFDPTVTAQGEPNPFGLQPVTPYTVKVPNYVEEPGAVVANRDNDPLLTTFFSSFKTSDGFLRELVPPEILRVFFVPDPDQLTGQVPGNGSMAFEFTEPMDPGGFFTTCADDPANPACIEVRYDADAQINKDNFLVNQTASPPRGLIIPGYFTRNSAATIYYFHPTFSFGNKKFVFNATVRQCLKDLSGNLLINPRSFGDFTVDGKGRKTGKLLGESFDNIVDQDPTGTDADWGTTEDGVLRGQPITTRDTYLYGYSFVEGNSTHAGQYAPIPDPLTGAALNQFVPNITPPTADGRRVLWAFSDVEIGADGSITDAAWGPDSNATFAANYPNIILRCGYQVANSINLSAAFKGNYEGDPTVVYNGSYQVTQAANVGNTSNPTVVGGYPFNGPPWGFCTAGWNDPLFLSTGFFAWPKFTNVFDWTEGVVGQDNDRVLLFDASVQEGDTFQQIRAWFAVTYPCSGVLIPGFENRRVYTTYEDEEPNPPTNFGAGVLNPEPTVMDTRFTITKLVSLAQTKFYTDGFQPSNSTQTTFGSVSNYLHPLLDPPVQVGGAQIQVEFYAADAVEVDRRTPNLAARFQDWTDDIDLCDGYKNIRWRMRLISNLSSNTVARLNCFQVPVLDDFQ